MKELLAHLTGDYVVQSNWMANKKTGDAFPAAVHALSYAACFLPLTRNPARLAVIAGTHYVIDRYRLAKHLSWLKNQIGPADTRPDHTATGYGEKTPDWLAFWLMIITDNTVHMLINHAALEIKK